jgi:Uncharacterised nucleotidyltransferase
MSPPDVVKESGFTGSFWPSPVQKLLLQTVVGPDDHARVTWSQLSAVLQFEAMEPGSYALMPLLYKKLNALVPDDALLPRLKGIYRRTLYANHLLVDRLRPTLEALVDSGIDAIVIAEPAVASLYYQDIGARQLLGLDLLVRTADLSQLLLLLGGNGWIRVSQDLHPGVHGAHPIRLLNSSGDTCSLHRRLIDDVADDGADPGADIWTSRTALTLAHTNLHALAPTDELLRICLQGARAQPSPNVHWVADAAMVVRVAEPQIDWNRLVGRATHQHAALRLLDALRYLRDVVSAPIPREIVDDLEVLPSTRRERLAHTASGRVGRFVGPAPGVAVRYLRTSANCNLGSTLVRLPAFLREEWGLERSSEVLGQLAKKAMARLRQRALVARARPTRFQRTDS